MKSSSLFSKYLPLILLVITFVLSLTYTPNSNAQISKAKLRKKKREQLAKIRQAEIILKETENKQKVSFGKLNALNRLIETRKTFLSVLQQEKDEIDQQIKELILLEKSLQTDLMELQEGYEKMMFLQQKKKRNNSDFALIISAESFNELYNNIQLLRYAAKARQDQVKEILLVKEKLLAQRNEIEMVRTEKSKILNKEELEYKKIIKLVQAQKKEVNYLKSQRKKLLLTIKERKRAISRLDNLIAQAVKAEIKKMALKNSKSAKAKVSVSTKQFQMRKGKLAWPVDGFIANKFGRHEHKEMKGVIVNNIGIGIQTAKNETVVAVHAGKIVRVANIPGMGAAVILKHGKYYTVYSKLKNVTVKSGAEIKEGQVLGKVNTDSKGISELDFMVWNNNLKLDPQLWLTSRK